MLPRIRTYRFTPCTVDIPAERDNYRCVRIQRAYTVCVGGGPLISTLTTRGDGSDHRFDVHARCHLSIIAYTKESVLKF
jgi:hypothetical protein